MCVDDRFVSRLYSTSSMWMHKIAPTVNTASSLPLMLTQC